MKKLLLLCVILIGLVSCERPAMKLPFTVIDADYFDSNSCAYRIIDANGKTTWIGPFEKDMYKIGDVIETKTSNNKRIYYDGEGNIIPDTIVDLMVKAYFVDIDSTNERILMEYINKR